MLDSFEFAVLGHLLHCFLDKALYLCEPFHVLPGSAPNALTELFLLRACHKPGVSREMQAENGFSFPECGGDSVNDESAQACAAQV